MNSIRWSWALATFAAGVILTGAGAWALRIELETRAEIAGMWDQARQQSEAQP